MAITWSTAQDEAHANGIKCLVYGPSGVGKTVLGVTAPKPLIISAEDGNLSLNYDNLARIHGPERAAQMVQTPIIKIRNGVDLTEAYVWCRDHAKANGIETIVWDSASETADIMLGASKAAKSDGRQAYGEVADIIAQRVRDFRAIPGINVVILAKMASIKDGVSGGLYWGPDFPGQKLGPASPYWLDEVLRVGVGVNPQDNTQYRYLQTGKSQEYDGKDRSGKLDFYEPADLTHVFNKITARAA